MSSTTRAQVTDLNGTAEGYPEDFYADDINADEPTTTPIAPPQLRFGLGENLEPVGWVDEDAYADAPHAAADDLDDAEEREQLARQLLAEAWEDRSAAAALADEVPPELAHAPVAATLDRARRAAFHRLAKPSDAAWTLPAPLRRAHRRVRPNDPPAWLRFRGGPIEHRPVFGQRRLVPRLRDYACSAAFFDAFKQAKVEKQQREEKAAAARKEKLAALKAKQAAAAAVQIAAQIKGQLAVSACAGTSG